jgi:hypothetical protein
MAIVVFLPILAVSMAYLLGIVAFSALAEVLLLFRLRGQMVSVAVVALVDTHFDSISVLMEILYGLGFFQGMCVFPCSIASA